jgi:hypothetical protein
MSCTAAPGADAAGQALQHLDGDLSPADGNGDRPTHVDHSRIVLNWRRIHGGLGVQLGSWFRRALQKSRSQELQQQRVLEILHREAGLQLVVGEDNWSSFHRSEKVVKEALDIA